MPTFQLRFSNRYEFLRLGIALGDELTKVMQEHELCCRLSPFDRHRLQNLVTQTLVDSITAYRCCGDLNRCHAPLTPIEPSFETSNAWWMDHYKERHREILLFRTEASFEEFRAHLQKMLLDKFWNSEGSPCRRLANRQLEEIFRSILGHYLFENPACEDCPRCTPDQQRNPTDPAWRSRLGH